MFSRFARLPKVALSAPRPVITRAFANDAADDYASKKYVHEVAGDAKNDIYKVIQEMEIDIISINKGLAKDFASLRFGLRESFHLMLEDMELKNNEMRVKDRKRIDDLDDCITEIHNQLSDFKRVITNLKRELAGQKLITGKNAATKKTADRKK